MAPKVHMNIRILQTLISGIPLILGLGTRMSDPYVYVVCWAPNLTGLGVRLRKVPFQLPGCCFTQRVHIPTHQYTKKSLAKYTKDKYTLQPKLIIHRDGDSMRTLQQALQPRNGVFRGASVETLLFKCL